MTTKLPCRFSSRTAVRIISRRFLSSNAKPPQQQVSRISSAMSLFLRRHKKKQQFLNTKKEEFNLGKKYLAKMMNLDEESLTKEDINDAIAYLLPSGLFDKRARPSMPDPEEIYRVEKSIGVSPSGRPVHYLFYTGKPNYFGAMHDIASKVEELMTKPYPEGDRKIVNMDKKRIWTAKELQKAFQNEDISSHDYKAFEKLMNRLTILPSSDLHHEFIYKFCKDKISAFVSRNLPIAQLDDATQKRFVEATGRKKRTDSRVKMVGNGCGKFVVNGDKTLLFFHPYYRAAILSPLVLTQMLGKVDIEARVVDAGGTSVAALRQAIALCIAGFRDCDGTTELLRQAGMLMANTRFRERKKPGQKGAHAKYPWRKR